MWVRFSSSSYVNLIDEKDKSFQSTLLHQFLLYIDYFVKKITYKQLNDCWT